MATAAHPHRAPHRPHAALHDDLRLVLDAARDLPRLGRRERATVRDEIVDWLHERVLPDTPLETVTYDELALRYWARRLTAATTSRPEPLQELLFGLHALVSVYLWKEEW